ncbi:MAG: hypothetical protein AAF707_00085 [Pseudomonadota bacterium]
MDGHVVQTPLTSRQAYPRLRNRRRSLRPMLLATTALCFPIF